jgi:hypothetical protein
VLAIVLSSLWGLPALAAVVLGIMLIASGRNDDGWTVAGFAEFFGGALAVAGGAVLAAAVIGIMLGRRMLEGRARVAPAVVFILFAVFSGLFLVAAIADDSGADPGGIVVFGANTAACAVVAVCALASRRST